MLDGYLTKDEANMNEICTQKIDFDNPSKDLVCGLPGFFRPVDRAKQLEMVRERFHHNENLAKNPV